MITQEYLKECLSYDPVAGVFVWSKRPIHHFSSCRSMNAWNARFPSNGAGSVDQGYLRIRISGHSFLAHRLAWLYMTGSFPDDQVDHINGDRSDNRMANLRCVTHSDNVKNAKIRADNSSGRQGVSFDKGTGKWRAHIGVNGRGLYLGLFGDFEDAVCARENAETKYCFHPNHGSVRPVY